MNERRQQALKRAQAVLSQHGVKLSLAETEAVLKRLGQLVPKVSYVNMRGKLNALYVLGDRQGEIKTLAYAAAPTTLQKQKVRKSRFITLWSGRTRRGSFKILYRGKQLVLGYGDYIRSDCYFLSIDEVKQLIKLMNSYRKSYTKGTSLSPYIGGKCEK